jgi:thiamine monophosphate synthase
VCAAVAVPVVASGGIGLDEVPRVVEAGAAAAAIISAVSRAPDVAVAARRVTAAFRI